MLTTRSISHITRLETRLAKLAREFERMTVANPHSDHSDAEAEAFDKIIGSIYSALNTIRTVYDEHDEAVRAVSPAQDHRLFMVQS